MSKDKKLNQDPVREKLIGFIEYGYKQKNNILNGIAALVIIIGIGFFIRNTLKKLVILQHTNKGN